VLVELGVLVEAAVYGVGETKGVRPAPERAIAPALLLLVLPAECD
jgi:hypothetical protein